MTPIQILGNVLGPSARSQFAAENYFLFETDAFEEDTFEEDTFEEDDRNGLVVVPVPSWIAALYKVEKCFLLPKRLRCKTKGKCVVALPVEQGQTCVIVSQYSTSPMLPDVYTCSFEDFLDILFARKQMLSIFSHRASFLENYEPEWPLLDVMKRYIRLHHHKRHHEVKKQKNHSSISSSVTTTTTSSPKYKIDIESPCFQAFPPLEHPMLDVHPSLSILEVTRATITSPKYEVDSPFFQALQSLEQPPTLTL